MRTHIYNTKLFFKFYIIFYDKLLGRSSTRTTLRDPFPDQIPSEDSLPRVPPVSLLSFVLKVPCGVSFVSVVSLGRVPFDSGSLIRFLLSFTGMSETST